MSGCGKPEAVTRAGGAEVAALILTPAGVAGSDALAATMLYRLAVCWPSMPGVDIAYLLFHRRYP